MSDSKYSVLFMRDDRDVTRYRLSPFWLKMFIFTQVFLFLCAAGGIYMGVRGFKINADLQDENKGLEQRLVDAEVRLERLSNMEMILQSYDPTELQSLLTAATTEVEQQVEVPQIDLSKIFTKLDTRQVGVENLRVKLVAGKFTFSFELNNLGGNAVVGQGALAFVKNDGSTVPARYKAGDLSFQIQRFKRVQTSFPMPEGMEKKDLFGIRLEIKGKDGDDIYAETYPLYSILP